MSNKERRKAPVLRFKGFTDDWEQRKLKELAIFNPKDNLPEEFEYVDLESVIGTEMLSHKKTALSDAPSRAQRLAKKGDIFYQTVRPYQKNDYLFDKDAENYVFSTGYAQIRPKINGNFLFQLLRTERFVKKVLNECTGTSYPAINSKDLSNIKVSYTNYKEEQRSIGSLLDNLDNLVALQQRKLDELIQIKEGIGQGLLNRHYRNLSIRFNQENSPWKQTKLGKIASFVNGRAFKQKELMNRGLYPVLRVGNFYTNNKWYYSNLNLSSDKYANKGDLLYTWSASFGPHVWKGPKVIYHYHIWKINFDPAVISKAYLYEFLKLDKKEILANSNGSTMIHITKKDMENKMITIPDMNEQIKIGKILEKLDLKIELNKNKLNNLKSVKQFLLQKMFM